jgi:hypothetical protein
MRRIVPEKSSYGNWHYAESQLHKIRFSALSVSGGHECREDSRFFSTGRSHLNSAVRQSGIVLSRYGIDRRWVVAQGLVDLAVDPQLVKQHRQLSRDCNGGSFLGILSFAPSQIGPLRLLVLI